MSATPTLSVFLSVKGKKLISSARGCSLVSDKAVILEHPSLLGPLANDHVPAFRGLPSNATFGSFIIFSLVQTPGVGGVGSPLYLRTLCGGFEMNTTQALLNDDLYLRVGLGQALLRSGVWLSGVSEDQLSRVSPALGREFTQFNSTIAHSLGDLQVDLLPLFA